MVWDISPIAFTVHLGTLKFSAHWYGMLFASTFVYGFFMFRYVFRRENRPAEEVYDLVLWVIGGTLIGARLGHVLFYRPGYFFSHPLKIPAVWEGGLASHGALLGILIAVWLYSRRATNQPFLWICDRIGMAVPLSGCLIRIGNFFNSELLGHPSNVPWALVFARVDSLPRHPVQLYEAISYLLIFLIQFRYYRASRDGGPPGYLFGRFLTFVFGARFVLEFFKESQAEFDSSWTITMGQWLSVLPVLIGLCLVWRASHRQRMPARTPSLPTHR
jgi:prolipoprotein diacylglyceryl transferase